MRRLVTLIACLILPGCFPPETERAPPRSVAEIQASGQLRVLTLISPTTFYYDGAQPAGFEYDLTQALADSLGVAAEYQIYDDLGGLIDAIARAEGDIAAGAITITEDRARRARFGPAYHRVSQQVVCRRDGPMAEDLGALAELRVAVLADSSYEAALQATLAEGAAAFWSREQHASAMPLLQAVHEGRIDCTIADSNLVAIALRRYPELDVAFTLVADQSLAWMLPPEAEDLASYLESWFAEQHESGLLERLDEKHFGFLGDFDYVELARFQSRACLRLPKYLDYFIWAAAETDIPWTLLAAISYQESHWNPRARSPTGVRGMMMLTLPTARSVGVKSRLDPEQSIMGGARYLRRLIDRLPEDIEGDDRYWFALAAYNVGWGHMQDARALAERLGRNPNIWADVAEVFPLLTRPEHYRQARHGYVRGHAPVRYVARIREYRAALIHLFPEESATPEIVAPACE